MADLLEDLVRLSRLARKLTNGETTLGDLASDAMAGKAEEPGNKPKEGEEKCKVTPGCIEAPGHSGGCCIDVPCEVA